MENVLYCIEIYEDYSGGGIVSIHSTFELAKEAADKADLNCVQSIEIFEMMVDNPQHEGKDLGYYRHG